MQLGDGIGGVAVDRGLFDDLGGVVFQQEAEPAGLARQALEGRFPVLAVLEIVQADAGNS